MSETPHPTKSAEPTPEQLLTLLDLQIAAQRARRSKAPRNRAAMIVVALLVIVLGTFAALLILQQTVADLPRPDRSGAQPAGAPDSQ